MSSGHQQTDLFQRRHFGIYFTRNSPFMNDQQTIRQTGYFLELSGDEQDRAPVVTQTHQLPVNKLDRTDIDTARRLRHE